MCQSADALGGGWFSSPDALGGGWLSSPDAWLIEHPGCPWCWRVGISPDTCDGCYAIGLCGGHCLRCGDCVARDLSPKGLQIDCLTLIF